MKRAPLYVCALFLLLLLGCRSADRNVVVIEETRTYHLASCPRTKMANTEIMTIAEARSLHYRPCSACRPDTLQ